MRGILVHAALCLAVVSSTPQQHEHMHVLEHSRSIPLALGACNQGIDNVHFDGAVFEGQHWKENPAGLTDTLQDSINACHSRYLSGATFVFPPDELVVGSIILPSNFNLHVPDGGVMRGTVNRSGYPLIKPLPSYGTARDNAMNVSVVHRPLVYAPDTINIRISGSGIIDGNGGVGGWWDQGHNHTLPYQRPRLIQFVNASNIDITGVTLQNSAFWTLHLVYSQNVNVRNVSIHAPRDSPNTDGIDIDSTSDVYIIDCTIDVGDDAVAVKSGLNWFGRNVNIPSTNILIEHNRIWGKAIAVGSEMSGGVWNVTAQHNLMGDPNGSVTGFLIKSARGRGGVVKDIWFRSNHLLNVSKVYSWIPALVITDYYGSKNPTNASATPVIRDITIEDIRVDFAEQIGCLDGLPEAPLTNIVFKNISVGDMNQKWGCKNCVDCDPCDPNSANVQCAFT